MNQYYTQELIKLGASLTELAVRGTATLITAKIQSVKEENKVEIVRSTYDEVVNQLLEENSEAIRIAQAYKAELDRVSISDEDIEHLHNTVTRIIEIIKVIQLASVSSKGEEEQKKVDAQIKSFEQFKELISVDTLKTMQLLGFNYKAAIGEPLTELCANAIRSIGEKKNVSKKR